MSSMSPQRRAIAAVVLTGLALFAILWMTAIGPKRAERADVREDVAAQQARLDTAQRQVAEFTAARERFPQMLAKLRRLDVAVPARGAVSDLLRELQRRGRVRSSDLRLAALKTSTAAPGTATVAPGATAAQGGLEALPFTFEYTGDYFDLVGILRAVRASVQERGGGLRIGGRLLTIDGLSFRRPEPGEKLTKAVVNATAYIAPDRTATPQPPAGAQPAPTSTQGGA
jgi:Tfp pilus assembly protein PilO